MRLCYLVVVAWCFGVFMFLLGGRIALWTDFVGGFNVVVVLMV